MKRLAYIAALALAASAGYVGYASQPTADEVLAEDVVVLDKGGQPMSVFCREESKNLDGSFRGRLYSRDPAKGWYRREVSREVLRKVTLAQIVVANWEKDKPDLPRLP